MFHLHGPARQRAARHRSCLEACVDQLPWVFAPMGALPTTIDTTEGRKIVPLMIFNHPRAAQSETSSRFGTRHKENRPFVGRRCRWDRSRIRATMHFAAAMEGRHMDSKRDAERRERDEKRLARDNAASVVAKEKASAVNDYRKAQEAEVAKTARLRALRLAREAAEAQERANAPAPAKARSRQTKAKPKR
jgi:hypothetical protein